MRKTGFGEPVLQPGDDFFLQWNMQFDENPDGEVARFLEEEDGKWGCEIMDNNDRTMQVNDFPTKEALVDWLKSQKVQID